jgi:hypothetical protein
LWTFTPNLLWVNLGEEAAQVTTWRRKHNRIIMFWILMFGY